MLSSLKFQVGLLATLQALLLTNNVTLIAVNGLAGWQLAADKSFATLPVTGYVLGAAVATVPAAIFMRRFGRRAGYTVGSIAGLVGVATCAAGVAWGSLAVLCAGTFVTGLYNAFGTSYRFAAVDAADAYRPDFRARAISIVLTGGIAGGVVGPELSKITHDWAPLPGAAPFSGTYLSLAAFAAASLVLAQWVRLPPPRAADGAEPARPLAVVLAQPRCWFAIVAAAAAYGIMNLLMVATPLAMQVCSHPYEAAALVLEWHVIGMFLPGLFTGRLIARAGVLPVMMAGCALMGACAAVALAGVDVPHFLVALVLLGVGWNFLYTGATTLLTGAYRASEKNVVQGFNDLCVFATMITSSLSSGVLLHRDGWAAINALSVPIVLAVLGGCAWLAARHRTQAARVAGGA